MMPAEAAKRAHLVGIGGTGMSALARLYLGAGWTVSGSDRVEGEQIGLLRKLGVVVAPGAGHLRGVGSKPNQPIDQFCLV